MSDGSGAILERIDLYLDGQMDAAARAEFEGAMAGSAELRAAVQRQRRIDDSLRRVFAAPSAEAILGRLNIQPAKMVRVVRPVARPFWRNGLAIAACLAAMAFGLRMTYTTFFPPEPKVFVPPLPTLEVAYQEQVAHGFHPYWTCDSDKQFADTFEGRLHQPLLADTPVGAKTWGLAYARSLSERTILVLADVDGTRGIVFVDRCDAHPEPAQPSAASGLHLFHRVIGSLDLYEMTAATTPHLLKRFRNPSAASTPVRKCGH